jgi:succinoglycan biosynthesis transport protein ExoP
MNLVQLFRLIGRHIVVLILAPIIMSSLVFLMTRNEKKIYKSETTVYTGLASGYTIESGENSKLDFFGTKNAFDNLINIINSRETLEEVGLRLLATHLLLDGPNQKYLNKENYNKLQSILPDEIKALVYFDPEKVEGAPQNIDIESEEQIVATSTDSIAEDENVIDQNIETSTNSENIKYHIVKKSETLYRISQEYGVSIQDLMKYNDLLSDNNIREGQKLIIQPSKEQIKKINGSEFTDAGNIYYVVDKKETLYSISRKYNISTKDLILWNNLKDRNIQIGQKLIVGKVGTEQKEEKNPLPEETYEEFDITIEEDAIDEIQAEIKQMEKEEEEREELNFRKISDKQIIAASDPLAEKNSIEKIFEFLNDYKNQNDTNFVYELLNYNHPHYSINAISRIRVFRIGNSDLVEISYENNDPGVCQHTLVLLIKVFRKNFKIIKENQTDAVVRYFLEQVRQANKKLQDAEDELLFFNQGNNIINYYEQTKFIASEKEDLDVEIQKEQMNLAGAEAAMKEISARLDLKNDINLKSTEISKKRAELSEVNLQLAMAETFADSAKKYNIVELKRKKEKIENELQTLISGLYGLYSSEQGVPVQEVLLEWIRNVIAFEESNARLQVLENRKIDFLKRYELFAPLGATLKRIERKIDVAEREYLSHLHSLNLSKLKQQNIELSSNIKPVDEPYFPIKPKASKRKMLIIAAGLAGFVIVFFLVVLLEFFDATIKTPERAEKLTTLKLAGALPRMSETTKVNYPFISNRLIEMFAQQIKLFFKHRVPDDKILSAPKKVIFISTRSKEGKTFIALSLVEKLRNQGDKVLFLNRKNEDSLEQLPEHDHNIEYEIDDKLAEINDIDILAGGAIKQNEFDYIILELPSLIFYPVPSDIITANDFHVLVCRANRIWNSADNKALDVYKTINSIEPRVFINGTKIEALETIIGEIPKKRKRFRRIFKKVLGFQFYSRNQIEK